eukprot:14681524-Alexandrium_andersonii.AAC.1
MISHANENLHAHSCQDPRIHVSTSHVKIPGFMCQHLMSRSQDSNGHLDKTACALDVQGCLCSDAWLCTQQDDGRGMR